MKKLSYESIDFNQNRGSTIAKIIGENVQKFDYFDKEVKMYVYEEQVNGRNLTEIINMDHENVKYLPGHILPPNVKAVPDIVETCHDADLLIFVLPHKFVVPTCRPLVGKLKKGAFGLSLIKGFGEQPGGGVVLVTKLIKDLLGIGCGVLMGANLAPEVAAGKFCETTIGKLCFCFDFWRKPLFKITPIFFKQVSSVLALEKCCATLFKRTISESALQTM